MTAADELEAAYRGKRVVVTGHTGFKGAWLVLWLRELGAEVNGLALPPLDPSLFRQAEVSGAVRDHAVDVRDAERVASVLSESQPEIIFHLAAQPLVRAGYARPIETLETNILGTANVLDGVRTASVRCAVVVVTSDKCYENRGDEPCHEDDRLGGGDPYSVSKAGAELVTDCYRRSYFPRDRLSEHGVALASARAGNVLGGGDWGAARIVPDAIRALSRDEPIQVRHPDSVRPWQHVLEPLHGYLLLGAGLLGTRGDPAAYCEAWNFGPVPGSHGTVSQLVKRIIAEWGSGSWEPAREPNTVAEAPSLRLDSSKAQRRLGWRQVWDLERTCARTVEWYRAWRSGSPAGVLRQLCVDQIGEHSSR